MFPLHDHPLLPRLGTSKVKRGGSIATLNPKPPGSVHGLRRAVHGVHRTAESPAIQLYCTSTRITRSNTYLFRGFRILGLCPRRISNKEPQNPPIILYYSWFYLWLSKIAHPISTLTSIPEEHSAHTKKPLPITKPISYP